MGLEQNNEQHYREVVDKYSNPFVDYQMTTRDYVLRPYTDEVAITITLPPVAEAKGRFYSIRARACSLTYSITIQDKGNESEGWEGDIVLYETGQGCLLYSDGLSWMLRTFADIEIEASLRGAYFKARGASGEIVAVRARGEAAGAASAYGVHAQGIAYTALTSTTVNALYGEAIIKADATVTTVRGAMITCNAEGTGHTITNMIGVHIRTYTVTQPGGYYRTLLLEHEKFGANPGIPLTEYIKIIDASFSAAQTAAAYGLRMLTTGMITTGISLESPMTNGIVISSTLYTATGRAIRSAVTLPAGNLGDGYGVNELDLTLSGVAIGHIAATSSWVNLPSGVVAGTGGNFIAAQTNGVWSDAGATISGGAVIFGMHMQAIMGTADPQILCPFSINVSGDVTHAIFYTPSPVAQIGYVVDAGTAATKIGAVPLFTTDGTTKGWVRIYDNNN